MNEENQIHEESTVQDIVKSKDSRRMHLKKPKRSSKAKGFLSTIAAGVIGAALTFTAVPFLPQFNEDTSAALSSETNSSKENVQLVSNTTNSLADTIESASKAIVGITNLQQQTNPFNRQMSSEAIEAGTGSGVIFKKGEDGTFIVTNNHVIEGAQEVEVSLYNGEKVSAKLVGTDPLTDIAVLKIEEEVDAEPLSFADSSTLRPGDTVLAIGNPLGLDLSRTVTQGIVSAVDRSIEVATSAGNWEFEVIQTDAAINPGNSGGALINTSGQLVGINSLKISDSNVEGLGFAIPSNSVQTIIDELIENGQVVRPYLGVGLANVSEIPPFYLPTLPENITQGAIITSVDESSAAAKAGITVEDVIVSMGGKEVTGADDLRKYLYSDFSIGDTVDLEFYRDGKLNKVSVTLTSNQTS